MTTFSNLDPPGGITIKRYVVHCEVAIDPDAPRHHWWAETMEEAEFIRKDFGDRNPGVYVITIERVCEEVATRMARSFAMKRSVLN